MSAYEAGDTATLNLTVVPADPTTTATVAVTDPAGTLTAPTATPNTGRDEWTALLLLDQPGEWLIRWTVTGVGAGVETQRLLVAPAPGTAPAGARVYATTADLATHLGAAPPAGAARLLARASADLDALLIGAIYDTDDNDLPTDPGVAAVLRDAVCAQAAHRDQVAAGGRYESVSIGSVKLSRPTTGLVGPGGQTVAAEAVHVLHVAGLLPIHPYTYG